MSSNLDYAALIASGETFLPPPPPVQMASVISRWQCAVQLRVMSLITEAEALEMIRTAAPPAYVEALFAVLTGPEQQKAREDFGADFYDFENTTIDRILPAGTTNAQKEDFFRAAGQLKP
jgi:hypothetical protein